MPKTPSKNARSRRKPEPAEPDYQSETVSVYLSGELAARLRRYVEQSGHTGATKVSPVCADFIAEALERRGF